MYVKKTYDKDRPGDKEKAQKRILEVYEDFKRTKDESVLEEIQDIVDQMNMYFVMFIEEPERYRITFEPRIKKKVRDLGKIGGAVDLSKLGQNKT